jgi:hypothetical protein
MAAPDKIAPTADAAPFRGISRDNALERLRDVACPRCGAVGEFETYTNPNNNGVGLRCRSCRIEHPFRYGHGVHWLPQDPDKKRRPPNDIIALAKECGDYCYGCGTPFAVLKTLGVGVHVHHTQPYAEHGDDVPRIPTCALCHELLSASQRHMARLAKAWAALTTESKL